MATIRTFTFLLICMAFSLTAVAGGWKAFEEFAGDVLEVAKTPVDVTVATIKGGSASGELQEGLNAAKDASLTVLDKMPKSSPGTSPSPNPEIPNQMMDPSTVVAVAIVLWVMLDDESFCDIFNPNGTCNVNAGIGVNSDGEISTPGSEGYSQPKEEVAQAVYDNDLLNFMRKQFAPEWEQEMWKEKFVISGSFVIKSYLPNAGVTWIYPPPANVTESGDLREEKGGSPLMGSRRIRGSNYGLHMGTDYATTPGDKIYAPVDGTLSYQPNVWKGFGKVVITTDQGHEVSTLYVSKSEGLRYDGKQRVTRGQEIGIAENIHRNGGYETSVPNHVHTTYKSPEGVYLSPKMNYGITSDANWLANHCGNSGCLSFNDQYEPRIAPPTLNENIISKNMNESHE